MFVFLSLAVLLVSAEAKFYTDCGSKLSTVQTVGVSGCKEDAKECILRRNSNVTISIDFTPKKETTSLKTDVHGVIMNMPIPFPMADTDACKDKGLTCPLKPDVPVSYKATLPVLKAYPKVNVDVKWELKNGNDEDLVCILITSRLN